MAKTLENLLADITAEMEEFKEAWSAFGDNPHTSGRATAMNIAQRLVERHFKKYI